MRNVFVIPTETSAYINCRHSPDWVWVLVWLQERGKLARTKSDPESNSVRVEDAVAREGTISVQMFPTSLPAPQVSTVK